nr:histone-lysine N-methyltransferase, H3 lysine-9 specific SUVH4 isoform X1 [Tanacetum cinerariifolium]
MRISSVPMYDILHDCNYITIVRLVSLDITGGQEELPIPVINTIDDTTITVPSGMKLPPNVAGCKCKGGCTNSKTCTCAKLNGGDFPYVQESGGR